MKAIYYLTWPQYSNISKIIFPSVFNQLRKVNLSPTALVIPAARVGWPVEATWVLMTLYWGSQAWVGDNRCLRLSPHSKMCSALSPLCLPPTCAIKVHYRLLIGWHWLTQSSDWSSQPGNRWKLNSSGKSLHCGLSQATWAPSRSRRLFFLGPGD